MRFKATDVFVYYKPSRCARRVSLEAHGIEPEEAEDPFMDLLAGLGHRHEAAHLATLSDVLDLSEPKDDRPGRAARTLDAIRRGAPAIYQPCFSADVDLGDGESCEVVGDPDFLIRDASAPGGGYVVRDAKLARNPLSDRHAGIPLQLQVYGYLYERTAGEAVRGLEVLAGDGSIVSIPYEGAARVLELLREQRDLRAADPSGYEPVGWSKCAGCGYETRCWSAAEAAGDAALLPTVNQDRARELHARGIRSISDLAAAVDNEDHHDYFWQGKRAPRHKDFVEPLLRSAEAHLTGRHIVIAPPELPPGPSFAMFDLEGIPPNVDELDRTYLWGVKVFGADPSGYVCGEAGFGKDGDRKGWLAFLGLAERLFDRYGPDLPFVCWSHHERTRVNEYVRRYGDPAGVAARVLANLVDLLAAIKKSVVLPLPSYSLKVVERHVGFVRRLDEAGGQWSIAKYIEATETADADAREAKVGEIRAYNEEDLDATWAVMGWLRGAAR